MKHHSLSDYEYQVFSNTSSLDREYTFYTVLRIASVTATEVLSSEPLWDLLSVSWEQNTEICLHVDNSDIDISPCSFLVAKRFTLDRLRCIHNKAFWSTKHLLQRSEPRNSICLTLVLLLPSQTGAQAQRPQACHCYYRKLLYITLARLSALTEEC